jgi:hypothetical protein
MAGESSNVPSRQLIESFNVAQTASTSGALLGRFAVAVAPTISGRHGRPVAHRGG